MARRLPDQREAIEGGRVAAATAAGLLSNADLLALSGGVGTALARAVLALEESVQARTLGAIAAAAAPARPPGFSEDDVREIVDSGHRGRHDAGLVQHVAAAFPGACGRITLGLPVDAAEVAKIEELRGLLATANSPKQAGFTATSTPWPVRGRRRAASRRRSSRRSVR